MSNQVPESRSIALAKALGYAGLIPFVCTVLILVFRDDGLLTRRVIAALTGYGAVILSFMGAVHWGRAMFGNAHSQESAESARISRYIASVCPAIVAWLALLTPTIPRLILLILGFCALYIYDVRALRDESHVDWYLRLRAQLTSVVVVCLALALYLFI